MVNISTIWAFMMLVVIKIRMYAISKLSQIKKVKSLQSLNLQLLTFFFITPLTNYLLSTFLLHLFGELFATFSQVGFNLLKIHPCHLQRYLFLNFSKRAYGIKLFVFCFINLHFAILLLVNEFPVIYNSTGCLWSYTPLFYKHLQYA